MAGSTGFSRVWRRTVRATPSVLYLYVRLTGILSILAWLSSGLIIWLFGLWELRWLNYLLVIPSLPFGLMMLLLSVGVRRRKRAAWRILVVGFSLLFALMLLSAIYDPGDVGPWVATLLYGVAIVALVASRKKFSTLPDRANRRLALQVFAGLLLLVGGIGTSLVHLTNRDAEGSGWGELLYVTLQTLLGPAVTGKMLDVDVPGWVDVSLGILGSGLLVLTVWALLRPGLRRAVLTPAEELAARDLLARWGESDSLGYFALRRDKDVITSGNGRAGIAYRVEGSVSLASGDPLGEPESWPGAIEAWLAECRAHAWLPGVLGTGEAAARAYGEHGLLALELGDEAILDLGDFTLEGREMRQVRQAVHRVERAGYTARIRRHSTLTPEEMAELVACADAWRDGATERGFSMALGRLGDPADGRCVVVEAYDAQGKLRGMLNFVPWGRRGLSLDLMRRDRDAENGLNEFMVAKLAESARTIGVNRVSLNFATLRSVFERGSSIGAGPLIRLAYRGLLVASRFWQLESLYMANAKYRPDWVPRYLCFRHHRDLMRIGAAAARAEGFLPSFRAPSLGTAPPSPELLAEIERIETDAADAASGQHRQLSEQERVRHAKLDRIRDTGMDPYPLGFDRSEFADEIRERFGALAPGSHTGETVAVAGRLVRIRQHGKLSFATLRDETGDLQVMVAADTVGEESLRDWKNLLDLGDQVGVRGEVITSKTGELSVLASSWKLTAKCLRPLPRAHSEGESGRRAGLTRQRYVDLIIRDEARRMLTLRADAIAAVRDELRGKGYMETETPMLQPVHGGASARPFVTRMNAYDLLLYLRIAPELYLKRLLVGGVGKVFELNRNFRNEGVDTRHNPEFTMLEAYEPYGDYDTMAVLIQDLVVAAARAALGTTVVTRDGKDTDLAEPWESVTVYGSASEALGAEITPDTPLPELRKHAEKIDLAYDPDWGQGRLAQELYEELVEGSLTAPTFVRDFPAETSPLTREHRDDPRLSEKWDLIVFGMELGTAYSEMIDPVEQRQRLTEQSLLAAGGDPEAMQLDEDFLRALEYGMPPAGGMGMGVDRLLMTLTGKTIRDTIPFPLVRPGG